MKTFMNSDSTVNDSVTVYPMDNGDNGRPFQSVTSAGTSTRTEPRLFKAKCVKDAIHGYTTVVNYGAGKWASEQAEQIYTLTKCIDVVSYDPYNIPFHENVKAREYAWNAYEIVVLLSNVLNVIDSNDAMENVVRDALNMNKYPHPVFITVYEGDKSGIGRYTSKGYQRNLCVLEYAEWIAQRGLDVVCHTGGVLEVWKERADRLAYYAEIEQ